MRGERSDLTLTSAGIYLMQHEDVLLFDRYNICCYSIGIHVQLFTNSLNVILQNIKNTKSI